VSCGCDVSIVRCWAVIVVPAIRFRRVKAKGEVLRQLVLLEKVHYEGAIFRLLCQSPRFGLLDSINTFTHAWNAFKIAQVDSQTGHLIRRAHLRLDGPVEAQCPPGPSLSVCLSVYYGGLAF
jgi:hypothetical protein